MKCNKCNQIIPDDSEFCHLCGNKISEKPTYAEPKKPKKEKKPMSKKTRKTIMLTTIFILSLAIIAILVFLFIIPMVKYNHAQELLESGKYDLAYTAFADLDNYGDSQDKLIETRYLQAVDYRKAGEYDVANSIFESLGDYRDSKALIHIHDYTITDSVAPTCTSKGSETTVCSACGESKVKVIEAKAHNYVLSKQVKPTCIASGEDLYACTDCGASYKNAVAVVPHNYVLAKQTNATCLSAGEKRYSCSMCGDSYTEKIAQTSHNWTNATCTAPKTCTTCGRTEGSALGHSGGALCTRCGTKTFTTLTYSGVGSKVIDYSIPKGKFKFTLTKTSGSSYVSADLHYSTTYGDSYKYLSVSNSGDSDVEYINGQMSGTVVVNGSSDYFGNSGWILTIEAAGN